MATLPQWKTQIGWGAPQLPAVNTKPKTTVSTQPYDPWSDVDEFLATLLAGPAKVQPPSADEIIRQTASAWDSYSKPVISQFERQQKLANDYALAQKGAATEFSAAMAEILQGGKTGQEGMDYALENFGGSYMGALAAQYGQQLHRDIQAKLDEEQIKLGDQLAEFLSTKPEFEQKVVSDIMGQVEAQQEAALDDWKTQIQLYGLLEARAKRLTPDSAEAKVITGWDKSKYILTGDGGLVKILSGKPDSGETITGWDGSKWKIGPDGKPYKILSGKPAEGDKPLSVSDKTNVQNEGTAYFWYLVRKEGMSPKKALAAARAQIQNVYGVSGKTFSPGPAPDDKPTGLTQSQAISGASSMSSMTGTIWMPQQLPDGQWSLVNTNKPTAAAKRAAAKKNKPTTVSSTSAKWLGGPPKMSGETWSKLIQQVAAKVQSYTTESGFTGPNASPWYYTQPKQKLVSMFVKEYLKLLTDAGWSSKTARKWIVSLVNDPFQIDASSSGSGGGGRPSDTA